MAKTTNSPDPSLQDAAPFEAVLDRLEHVVDRLEEGELSLEESLAIFEEGVRLSRLGAKRLDEAEERVEVLLADMDGVETELLDEEN